MSLTVVGPDGAGKTTFCERLIKSSGFKGKVVHSIHGWASNLPLYNNKLWHIFRECLVGLDSLSIYIKLHLNHKDVILDRCFLDAEVYTAFWGLRCKSLTPYKIAQFFNKFAYKPEVVFRLNVDPMKAKPKRSDYGIGEIEHLNSLYWLVLVNNKYVKVAQQKYDLGVVEIWRKDMNS